MKPLSLLVAVWWAARLVAAGAGNTGAEVVVVYNSALAESKEVAAHYAKLRQVPDSQVVGLTLSTNEAISRAEYREQLEQPLRRLIAEHQWIEFQEEIVPARTNAPGGVFQRPVRARIRYLVLCYGVPLKIGGDASLNEPAPADARPELRRNDAAVDNELCLLPRDPKAYPLTGLLGNPFLGQTNAALLHPTNGLLMVARLDGPTASVARRLVSQAVYAETYGLWGRAYFDARGIQEGPYAMGDAWVRNAAEVARRVGFETVLDTQETVFPAGYPLSHVALYMGWYEAHAAGPFAQPKVEFMPGAFAYHLHSYNAPTLRTTDRHWAGPLLAKGATATIGFVEEPYLQGTINLPHFLSMWIRGFTFGEAAYVAQNVLSWQTTVIGDPLYRPFGQPAEILHTQLLQNRNPLVAWSILRAINQNMALGERPGKFVTLLESDPLARSSAILQEKLAALYAADNKLTDAADTLLHALTLQPSPVQRARIVLELANRLPLLGRAAKAYELLESLRADQPDYPDPLALLRPLAKLAGQLGKTAEQAKYQSEIDRLTAPGPANGSPTPK
jgi:uncharacterized protein (TIGR03790 family)